MSATQPFADGGYRYLPGLFQYSGGVAAASGFRIERVRFARPLPLADGFAAIEAHLRRRGRPLASLCACELRSPRQFTEAGFDAFNRIYVARLAQWGVFRDGVNPVARTNVCPEIDPPASPSLHAFSHTTAAEGEEPGGFVAAGSGEARWGAASYAERIIRLGDTSLDGLREKVRFVVGEMERRMQGLGFGWAAATATQAYTVRDIHPLLAEDIIGRGAMPAGLIWHYARPPVEGLDFEMDVLGVGREFVI